MSTRRQLLFGAFLPGIPADSVPAAVRPAAGVAPQQTIAIGDACLADRHVVCRSCGESCPHDAIRFPPRLGGAASPVIDAKRCTGCGDCLAVCPSGALQRVACPSTESPHCSAEEFAA